MGCGSKHKQRAQKIGKIEPIPKTLSDSFHDEIIKSKDYYNNGLYEKAYNVLQKAIEAEPKNPFILEPFARALYQIPEQKRFSYDIYKRLISILDNSNKDNLNTITINMWFREAYWKLGTLHMDFGEWEKAQLEINRFLMSIQELKGSFVYVQALEYLTECYFELKIPELYEHFAKRTLFYNPENEYVKNYIKIQK